MKLSMTTREIAELTGKEHRNVVRDTRAMFASLSINLLSFEQVYKAGNGQEQIEYVLDRDLTMTLVTGYDVAMRHRVMKRWRELEAGAPLSTVDLLRMAAAKIEAQWCAAGSLYPVRFARANNFCQSLLLLPE